MSVQLDEACTSICIVWFIIVETKKIREMDQNDQRLLEYLINYLKLFPIFFSDIIYISVKFQKHFFDVKNIIQFLISTWRGAKRRDCVAWKLGRKLKYCSWKKEKNTSSITSFREKRSNTFVPFIRGKINIYLWNQHFSNKEREKKKRREHSWNNWTRYK